MNSIKAPESITSEDGSDLARQLKNHQNELGRIRMKLQENEQVIKRLQAEVTQEKSVQSSSQQHQQPQPPLRYNFKFNGHCFYCGIFGHRIANCFKRKNVELRFSRLTNMNHNKFEFLSSEIECPKCSKFGHTANNCRLDIQRSRVR